MAHLRWTIRTGPETVVAAAGRDPAPADGRPVMCPFCGEDRCIEPVGRVWFCAICAKTWSDQ